MAKGERQIFPRHTNKTRIIALETLEKRVYRTTGDFESTYFSDELHSSFYFFGEKN